MIELTISKLIYSEKLTYLQFVLYFFMSAGSTASSSGYVWHELFIIKRIYYWLMKARRVWIKKMRLISKKKYLWIIS